VSIVLNLLEDVRWRGQPVPGERPRALLAALAERGGRPVRAEELIGLVWGDEVPFNGMKSLQVLVSRTRTACGADAIVREGAGYRLGAGPDEVDSSRLSSLVREAGTALERDASAAVGLAREALALSAGPSSAGTGPLAEVREAAWQDAAAARVILARAFSRTGEHAAALPLLDAAYAERPDDESLLADLLRSEAVVKGPAPALERFERYRRDLRDRLGTDPGELLRAVHRSLLAHDRPVRRGVHYDATALIGRDGDLERLRALMASSRVVSIVGPGGLGKTRLAHALARDAAEPVVHVVELVGVTSAEDVPVEVGSVLGVRDSVSGRRILTAEQRADMRTRIVHRLGQAPGLLVLDNCEHLIGSVASLVAFLISATPDLRVLTTSRAPLAIAAERVYLLGELGLDDAAELFRERAVAARPGVYLNEQLVTSIVGRLDGLPLAIELAAAKTRAMSLEEIDRRLEDRFALLRGGDRSAPDRHQALLTVIEWSWNLLSADEQQALRWLALFPDGFTLEAAALVLEIDAAEAVRGLVDQSLLSVGETSGGLRYRMLETVREFGHLQLVRAGESSAARAALRRWATGYVSLHGPRLTSIDQYAAIDDLAAEETNLADELRAAIADGDRSSLVRLLAALGMFWTIRGEHARVLAVAKAAAEAIQDWQPPPELLESTLAAVGVTLGNSIMLGNETSGLLLAALRKLDVDAGLNPTLIGLLRVMRALDSPDASEVAAKLDRLADDPDRRTAAAVNQWLCHTRENAGDPVGSMRAARRTLALARDEDGPWSRGMPLSVMAQLSMDMGDNAAAVSQAQAALVVMRRLGASDDEIELRALLVLCAISDGRLADAETELELINGVSESGAAFGAAAVQQVCHAELALAHGDVSTGLRDYREYAARMYELQFPGMERTGVEPWAVSGAASTLTAHARFAAGGDVAHGWALFGACRSTALTFFGRESPHLDYPVAGMLLFALGTWSLLRQAGPADAALRLLALADRFAYSRRNPVMSWESIAGPAQDALPGRLASLRAEYADRRLPDLLAEARQAAEALEVPTVAAD
jgi:predicted ATPase/DNA-binding SARP family transcriptional activator